MTQFKRTAGQDFLFYWGGATTHLECVSFNKTPTCNHATYPYPLF